jgi:hypothetical protein
MLRATAIALVLATAMSAHASPDRCAAGKSKCVSKKATAILKCYSNADNQGFAPDTVAACIQKAENKFDGGVEPSAGCFERLESKFPNCLTMDDTAALEAKVDAFVKDVFCSLHPSDTSGTCSKLVFVTSTSHDGNLGGLDGADAICNSLASAAGLPGQYKAWLADDLQAPADRFSHSTVPYKRRDGATIANDWADLTDGAIAAPINLNEFGAMVAPDFVWTNVFGPGTAYGGPNCFNWASGAPEFGVVGSAESVSAGWTLYYAGSCDSAFRLYCFAQ